MQTYSSKITKLAPNQIFVFGSNTQGRHGKGSALLAKEKFGAIYGQSDGPQGQSYAIITKDLTKRVHPSVPKGRIIQQIKLLYQYAKRKPFLQFYVVYSGTGSNLNAYSSREMAEMFACEDMPENIVFEEEFAKLLGTVAQLAGGV
ncbi:MAG: hypothetical protein O2794_04530 [bacterium]|nr:hypothetical protein [bacterium]